MTTVFPITYMELAIWIFFMLVKSENANKLYAIRALGFSFGFLSGIDTLAGERWLFINDSGVASMIQFDDGIAPLIAAIMIFGSGLFLYIVMFEYNKARQKQGEM